MLNILHECWDTFFCISRANSSSCFIMGLIRFIVILFYFLHFENIFSNLSVHVWFHFNLTSNAQFSHYPLFVFFLCYVLSILLSVFFLSIFLPTFSVDLVHKPEVMFSGTPEAFYMMVFVGFYSDSGRYCCSLNFFLCFIS